MTNSTIYHVCILVLALLKTAEVRSFVTSHSATLRSLPTTNNFLLMVGGRGWDNQDYLGSLSGDDEDREQSKEQYKDFSERRAAFQKRQEELLKNSPQAQAFLQQRQQQQQEGTATSPQDGGFGMTEDEFGFGMDDDAIEEGSGGGTRMARMMAQAKRMQQKQRNPMMGGGLPGFEQKLAVPLDFDEDDEDEETKK